MIEILQTIGICVGSVALVAIALMLFVVISTFLPTSPPDDLPDEDDLIVFQGRSRDEIEDLLKTPVSPSRSSRRKRARRKKVADDENKIKQE